MSTKEINLKIHEEADLYSAFDPEQKLLSEDVTEYLARNYLNKHRSLKEKNVLHIINAKILFHVVPDQDAVQ